MVRFTSGETVPLAVTCVGRARVSALAVLNNWGCSVSKTSGSTVTGGLLVAAGVSFEQAAAPPKAAKSSANASQWDKNTRMRVGSVRPGNINFVIGLPHALRPDSAGLPRSDRSRPDLRNSTPRYGIHFPR